MVKNGFELKKISIEIAYVGCIGICCRIYDNAFYFLWSAEENGIYETEFNYYKADLDYIPKHGFYRYKTSPVMTGEWIIAGEMKVIKILSDQEVKKICDSCGSDYLPRKETINLSEFGFAA